MNYKKKPKEVRDLVASRNILAALVEQYERGFTDVYRSIAVELRKLLCDGTTSLVPRLFSNARLHPLLVSLSPEAMKGLVFHMPFLVSGTTAGPKITQLVNRKAQPIPLDTWLDQPLFNPQLTIRDLIRSVADKEAAHSSPRYNETLRQSYGVVLGEQPILEETIRGLRLVCARGARYGDSEEPRDIWPV